MMVRGWTSKTLSRRKELRVVRGLLKSKRRVCKIVVKGWID